MLSLIYEVKAAIEASEHGVDGGWCLSASSKAREGSTAREVQVGSTARAQRAHSESTVSTQ